MTDDIPPVPSHGFATPAEVAELHATIAGFEARVEALTGALASRGEELTKAWHRVEAADELAAAISAPCYGIHGMPPHVFAALKRYKAALSGGTPDAR